MRFTVAALLLALAAGAQAQSANVRQQGDTIYFEGRIDSASAARFVQLLADPGVRTLVIRSQGGLVGPALDMGEALFARGLDVEVQESCLSSCANYVFPAGRNKVLSGPLAVGWHGNMAHVLYRAARGEETWSEPDLAQARLLAQREEAFYRRIGVDGFLCWFGKLPPYSVDEFYTLAPQDMGRFGITGVMVRNPDAAGATDVQRLALDPAAVTAIRPKAP